MRRLETHEFPEHDASGSANPRFLTSQSFCTETRILDRCWSAYESSHSDSRQPERKGAAVADIFISYARDDDVPPPDRPDKKGFVTFLDESVQYEFRDLGPDRPKI